MTYYKLTDKDGYTRRGKDGETHWAVGTTVSPIGTGSDPCGPGVLHVYGSAEEAVLYDPIHGVYTEGNGARLFRVSTDATVSTDGLKHWTCGPVRVDAEIPLPTITIEERVAWAICVAPHESTRIWAIGWLSGANRSYAAAWKAYEAYATYAADVAWAAVAAARAERAAASAAVGAASAAVGAAWAVADAVERAAEAVADAAGAAAAEAMAARAADLLRYPLAMLARARAILAGAYPAEKYDAKEGM